MSLTGAFATYFIIWWVVLLAVLPFGVRTVEETGEHETGQAQSAPTNPRLVRKMLATTGIAFVLWLALFLVLEYELVSLDDLPVPGLPALEGAQDAEL